MTKTNTQLLIFEKGMGVINQGPAETDAPYIRNSESFFDLESKECYYGHNLVMLLG